MTKQINLKEGDSIRVKILVPYVNRTPLVIKQGDIGNFIDPWKNVHKGCVVVFMEENAFNVAQLYSPNYRESFAFFVNENKFTKTNGEQDEQTRKMNFEYAKQHSGNDSWEWKEENEG